MKGIFACAAFALVVVLASGEHDGGERVAPEIPEEFPVLYCPNCPIHNPGCDCPVDLVFLMDRSGSIDPVSFNNVREMIKDCVNSLDYECSRTSMVSFSDFADPHYGFLSPQATNPVAACNTINGINNPQGGTNTGDALDEAAMQFIFGGATPDGVCRVVVLFTDGLSNDRDDTQNKATALFDSSQARVCIMGMSDPPESLREELDRLEEVTGIRDKSHPTSQAFPNTDFSTDNFVGSAAYLQAIGLLKQCICRPCYTQP